MLYLIKSGNYLKIGYASDFKNRLSGYYTNNLDFTVIATKEGTLKDEKELHRKCKSYNYRNEWYHYCPEVIDIFNGTNAINDSDKELELKSIIYKLKEENSNLICSNKVTERENKSLIEENRNLKSKYEDVIREYKSILSEYKSTLLELIENDRKLIDALTKELAEVKKTLKEPSKFTM